MDPSLRLTFRIMGAAALLTITEGLCGLYGYMWQRSPSNFGCFFVIFTAPVGLFLGVAFPVLAERWHMGNVKFVVALAMVTVVSAGLTLLFIATRQ